MNGETSIRPYRIGTNSGTRVFAWRSSNSTGSARVDSGSNTACPARGTSFRAALPRAMRSATDGCGTAAPRFDPCADAVPPLSVVLVLVAMVVAFPSTVVEAT